MTDRKKVLVLGSGGREHAFVYKFHNDPLVSEVFCSPGIGGTSLIANNISCLHIIAIEPSDPPSAREPVSPIKTFAGGALNHKKPSADPIIAPQKTDSSPLPLI